MGAMKKASAMTLFSPAMPLQATRAAKKAATLALFWVGGNQKSVSGGVFFASHGT
jgi:hypothetical protein